MRRLLLVSLTALAACGGKGASPLEPAPAPNLVLSVAAVTLARGETTQVSATALATGRSRVDVSQDATWSSTNSAVVTAAAGTLTAIGPGNAEVQVAYGSGGCQVLECQPVARSKSRQATKN